MCSESFQFGELRIPAFVHAEPGESGRSGASSKSDFSGEYEATGYNAVTNTPLLIYADFCSAW